MTTFKYLCLAAVTVLITVFLWRVSLLAQNPSNQQPSNAIYQDANPVELEEQLYRWLEKTDFVCGETVRLGNEKDGGWDMCVLGLYMPTQPCLVYSFGINNDWSFDDAVSQKYRCHVRAFDPSMKVGNHSHSELVDFYSLGLHGRDEILKRKGWPVRTLGTLLNYFGEAHTPIDYLKIDIEESEWAALPAMFSQQALKHVKQLAMEVHFRIIGGSGVGYVRDILNENPYFYKALNQLQNLGFKKWHADSHCNYKSVITGKKRTACWNVLYVNSNFGTS